MAEPWKWGFTPGERRALLLICAAVLLGLSYQVYQRREIPRTAPLTAEEALQIASITAAAAITDSLTTSTPADGSPLSLLNINTATRAQLEDLPGIGPALAKRIVAARDSLGEFKQLEDLLAVPGIGPKRLDAIRPLLLMSYEQSNN